MRLPARDTRRRLLVALGVVATGLAIAVVLGAARLFGGGTSPRQALSQYITRVDAVQQQMQLRVNELTLAYRHFSTLHTSPATTKELGAAEQTLRTIEKRLAVIPAPADAVRLRALLLELVRDEGSIARELHTVASFLPRFSALVAVVARQDTRLGHEFAAAAPPKPHTVHGTAKQVAAAKAAYAAQATRAAAAQAEALIAYDRRLEQVVRGLRRLDPPAVMAPAYRSELHALEATATAGGRLAAELRKQNRSRVPELSLALTRASRLSSSIAAQRSEIAALKAYDARVRGIRTVEVRIQNVLKALQRSLG